MVKSFIDREVMSIFESGKNMTKWGAEKYDECEAETRAWCDEDPSQQTSRLPYRVLNYEMRLNMFAEK